MITPGAHSFRDVRPKAGEQFGKAMIDGSFATLVPIMFCFGETHRGVRTPWWQVVVCILMISGRA